MIADTDELVLLKEVVVLEDVDEVEDLVLLKEVVVLEDIDEVEDLVVVEDVDEEVVSTGILSEPVVLLESFIASSISSISLNPRLNTFVVTSNKTFVSSLVFFYFFSS